jgi:predicted transcriptional regulator
VQPTDASNFPDKPSHRRADEYYSITKVIGAEFMEETSIKTIMTSDVRCSSPKVPLSHVIRAMKQNKYSCMIIAEKNVPVGIITERDIVRYTDDLIQASQHHDQDAACRSHAKSTADRENC